IIPPEGFQVIEEMIFPEYSAENRKDLLEQVNILISNVSRLSSVTESTELTDSHIFDAMKLQVFRVITLGISGFDSPIAKYSISESAESLEALKEIFMVYQDRFNEKKLSGYEETMHEFNKSINFLKKGEVD